MDKVFNEERLLKRATVMLMDDLNTKLSSDYTMLVHVMKKRRLVDCNNNSEGFVVFCSDLRLPAHCSIIEPTIRPVGFKLISSVHIIKSITSVDLRFRTRSSLDGCLPTLAFCVHIYSQGGESRSPDDTLLNTVRFHENYFSGRTPDILNTLPENIDEH